MPADFIVTGAVRVRRRFLNRAFLYSARFSAAVGGATVPLTIRLL